MRLYELIDVKITLIFCLFFVVKSMITVVFLDVLKKRTHLLTYNYKIDVEDNNKTTQNEPFSSLIN